MVDVEYLSRLLNLLKEKNVASYRAQGVEITFGGVSILSPPIASSAPEPTIDTVGTAALEGQLPVDLRSDNLNSFDKVLNWSASPDPNEPALPGTDEQPLAAEA